MEGYINSFVEYLEKNRKLSKNTVVSYKRDLTFFNRFVDNLSVNLTEITKVNIDAFVELLKANKKSNSTIARYLVSIHRFYIYLIDNGFAKNDPTIETETPKKEVKLPKVLTANEIDRLLDFSDCTALKDYRDKAMLEVLYATGIKVSELIGLDLRDVDIKNQQIKVGNGNKKRNVPMVKTATEALSFYIENARMMMVSTKREKALFVNCSGERMTRQGFWKIVKTCAKRANIKSEITPQTLRNSFATHLLQNGADVTSVSEMLGYTDKRSASGFETLVNKKIKSVYNKAHPRA